jgi:hypothetical protein
VAAPVGVSRRTFPFMNAVQASSGWTDEERPMRELVSDMAQEDS